MPYLEQATGRFGLSRSEVRALTVAALPESDVDCAHLGYPIYATTAAPAITAEQRAVETAPATIAGVLTQQWSVMALTSAELAARPVPEYPVVNIASANIALSAGLVTVNVNRKLRSVSRLVAGRFRCTFETAQPDTVYDVDAAPIRLPADAKRYFCEPLALTTTGFDVAVTALSSLAGVLSMAAADPAGLHVKAWRVQK